MNHRKFKIGWRTSKTAIAVGLTVLLFSWLDRGSGLLACLAGVYSLQADTEQSWRFGRNRIFGNTIGVFSAILILQLRVWNWLPDYFSHSVGTAIGLMLVISVCNALNFNKMVFPASVAFLVVLLGEHGDNVISYGLNRVFDTIIGSLLALIVNYVLPSPHLKQPATIVQPSTEASYFDIKKD